MEIQFLLKKVLTLHKSFSIPGLGKFTSKELSAKINIPKGEISPPAKEILFDSKYGTDTILHDFLINQGLSNEQADKAISTFIEKIKTEISQNRVFEIDGFGVFYRGKEKEIFFRSHNKITTIEALGMQPVQIQNHEKTKQSKNKKTKKPKKVKKARQKKVTTIEKTQPKQKQKQKRGKAKKLIFILLPIVILIILLSIFHKPIFEKIKTWFPEKQTEQIIATTEDTLDKQPPANNPDIEFETDNEYRKFLDANISNSANVFIGENYKKFHIVVNSFKTEEYAENYAQKLRTKGYNPTIISSPDYYRVTIGQYNTTNNLIKDFDHYKTSFNNDIWILVNKK